MRKTPLIWLGLVVLALVTLGLFVLSSASDVNSLKASRGLDAYYYMKRQFCYLGGGLLVAAIVANFDYHKWRDWRWLGWAFFLLVVALMVGVLFTAAIKGSHRWISCGPISIQPSELAKLAVVMVVAIWMDRIAWKVDLFLPGAMCPALIIALPGALALAEPDFGAFMVIGAAGFLVMFIAGTKIMHLGLFATAAALIGGILVFFNQNRMERLFNSEKSYQAVQSLSAIGNGGIFGVGIHESMQKQMYLPEAHTDFIFAIGAEELGIIFSIAVVLLFVAFFVLSMVIAHRAMDRFGKLIVIGMSFIVFFQAMFNIGVVCKALPTKGMALPFFSYGGTNMIVTFFAVGMIFSVGLRTYREQKWKNRRTLRTLLRR